MAAPIALFVYNRLWHTQQTVNALQKNQLAGESDLFIFSDAPKNEESVEAVQSVREFIRTIATFKSVTIIERETNFGLAASIIDGVSRLCKEYGHVIVLEDDLITSPFFLKYMNDALELYAETSQVMHISGYVYPIDYMPGDTFFFRVPMCWGWATWDRSWRHFWKSPDIMLKFTKKMRREFSFNDSYHFWHQLEANQKGLIDTWFVYWYASVFLMKGLALFPSRSLVLNIGHDGTGVHCGVSNDCKVTLSHKSVIVEKSDVMESKRAVQSHYKYFRKTGGMPQGFLSRLPIRIYKFLKRKFQSILPP